MNEVVNVDWLAFSVRLVPTPREKDTHEFVMGDLSPYGFSLFQFSGNNIYKHRAIVYNSDGSKMLTLLWSPFSRVISYDSCLVEVANEYLYGRPVAVNDVCYFTLDWVLEVLQLLHPFTFQCMSRLDICCDFELDDHAAFVVGKLADNSAYVQRFSEGSMFHMFGVLGQKVSRWPKCLSWGSKHSNIKFKLYNKSLEIFDYVKEGDITVRHCSKPYIVAKWADAEFNDANVWRLEVSLTPMAKYNFRGSRVQFADVSNYFFIVDLFFSLYGSKFVTRLNEGHSDRSNDTRIWLLGDKGIREKLECRESSNSREVAEYVSCLRSAMAQRSKVEVAVNSQMLALWTNTAIECVRLGHLEGYFLRTYGVPIEDIEKIQTITQN